VNRNKTLLLVALSVVVFGVVASLVPLQSNINLSTEFRANPDAVFRQMLKDTIWHRWWPGTMTIKNKNVVLGEAGYEMILQKPMFHSFEYLFEKQNFRVPINISIESKSDADVIVRCRATVVLPKGLINRVKFLLHASNAQHILRKMMNRMPRVLGSIKGLYEFDIKESSVEFEFVATQSKTLKQRPTVADVYKMVREIEDYIAENHSTPTGQPMQFVQPIGRYEYFLQVALPVNKSYPSKNNIHCKWLLKGGQILTATVNGGPAKIEHALRQMENYIQDFRHSKVAIPYEYLVTNRVEQPDTSQWKTVVYYPVILKNPDSKRL
jgi:uncharacterized protein YndB with AHSA1/START domain